MVDQDFAGRVLPFDSNAARRTYAAIAEGCRAAGWPIMEADCKIAAIAHSHQSAIATRHVSDLDGCRIVVIDP